jgi:hypothetical protein
MPDRRSGRSGRKPLGHRQRRHWDRNRDKMLGDSVVEIRVVRLIPDDSGRTGRFEFEFRTIYFSLRVHRSMRNTSRAALSLHVLFGRLRRSDAALQRQIELSESETKTRISSPKPESSGIRRTTLTKNSEATKQVSNRTRDARDHSGCSGRKYLTAPLARERDAR